MKKLLPALAFLLLSTLLVTAARATREARGMEPAPGAQDLEARVTALEGELAAARKDGEETRALLDQTLAYLEAQAKSAQSMLGVLNESEQAGFTAGINFHSRELLLAGWRSYYNAQQEKLPKAKAKPKADAPAAPGARKKAAQ